MSAKTDKVYRQILAETTNAISDDDKLKASLSPSPDTPQGEKTPVKPRKPHWKTVQAQAKKTEAAPVAPEVADKPAPKPNVTHRVEPVKPGQKSYPKHTHTLVITIKSKVKKWALDHAIVDSRELAYYIAQSR